MVSFCVKQIITEGKFLSGKDLSSSSFFELSRDNSVTSYFITGMFAIMQKGSRNTWGKKTNTSANVFRFLE